MNDWLDNRSKIEAAIANALKSAIDAHGPITINNRASAAKRIYGLLKQLRREFKKEVERDIEKGSVT